ncbi:hypothetical protein KKA00_03950 [bacterium]|nr:hypothetical protein [bacterium]
MSRSFWILITLAFFSRLFLLFAVPLDHQPSAIPYFNDEAAHLNYVKYLADHHDLPVQTTSVQVGAESNEYEYYQPPLYYSLMQPFYTNGRRLTPGFELYWVRFGSLILSLAGLTTLFLAVRRHFGQDAASAVLLSGALAGIPLRFGSLVTNDSLLFCLACLFFAAALHLALSGFDRKLYWASILLMTAGLWTKVSFIVLLPVFWGLLYYRKEAHRGYLMAALILPFAGLTPWLLHNLNAYGSLLPLTVGFGHVEYISVGNIGRLGMSGVYFLRSFHFPYDLIWGGPVDLVVYPLLIVGSAALSYTGCRALHRLSRPVFWIAAGAIGLNGLAYLSVILRYYQSEARFFLPVFPFLLLLLVLGTQLVTRNRLHWTLALLGLWIALPWFAALT